MSKLFGRQFASSSGTHQPLGASVSKLGVNFALYSQTGRRVQLLIWVKPHTRYPSHTFELSATENKTGNIWHLMVHGLPARVRYAYRVDGPAEIGNRFDWQKVLLDPYAKALDDEFYSREIACYQGDNVGECLRGIVLADDKFDWGQDKQPKVPLERMVIYELHVKGATKHPSSQVTSPGTFAGLTEKLPYFQDLGVTSLELMPIQAFDDDIPYRNNQGEELTNYWGYSQLSFFALHPAYFSSGKNYYLSEFKKLVKTAHQLGLEIILDVVYNHTTEANEYGPKISWRGIDNQSYYLLSRENKNYYQNFTGCDNTFNTNQAMAAKQIVDSLEYLASEFHVDGFRFDLGAIFYQGEYGFDHQPRIIKMINDSPILRHLKLIAEPWDASGLMLLGRFGGANWLEWNGAWRDRVREYVNFGRDEAVIQKHLAHEAPEFVSQQKNPAMSVNFVTAHDGFTLRDVVSYNHKHNEENGYHNTDGADHNASNNYGVEGETDDQAINELRQQKAAAMLQLTAQTPGPMMILMGDEMWRTQGGNNNAFTQDNSISWLNWELQNWHQNWWEKVKTIIKSKSQS